LEELINQKQSIRQTSSYQLRPKTGFVAKSHDAFVRTKQHWSFQHQQTYKRYDQGYSFTKSP